MSGTDPYKTSSASSSASGSRWLITLNRADLITLSSVPLCGLALVSALQMQLPAALSWLFLAMTADALDGLLARRWNLQREFGRYLDGFMDVLIYLATPSVVLWQWGMNGWWALVLLPMVMAGCIRLAVFNQTGNIQRGSQLAYAGMPVFWSLLLIAPVILLDQLTADVAHDFWRLLSVPVLLLFSVLMVSKRPFFKFSSLSQMLMITLGGFALCVLSGWAIAEHSPLQQALLASLYLQIPVVIGGVAHMWCVSRDVLPGLAQPVHRRLFGENKTWRGFVLVPALTAAGALLLWPLEQLMTALGLTSPFNEQSLIWCGALAGLGYVLGELPNSFYKRRLGIAAGEVPEARKYWFMALDQIDSAVGVGLVYALILPVPAATVVFYMLTFPLTALLVKQWLYRHKLKSVAA